MKSCCIVRNILHPIRQFSTQTTTIQRPSIKFDKTLLQGYNSCHTVIDVQWGSMDTFAHVNNVVYSRWVEQARINTFNQFIQYAAKHNPNTKTNLKTFMSTHSIGPILKQITLKYRSPVIYPDTVVVGTRIHKLESDRLSMLHRIVSIQQNAIVVDADDIIVTFDYQKHCKADIPSGIYSALQQFMREMNTEQVVPYKPKHIT